MSVMQTLRVEARIQTDPVRRSEPCRVKVELTNPQASPVLVNGRLGVGYRNSLDRELFAEVYRRGEGQVISRESLLYQRDPSDANDYVWLKPGEAISTSFDLFEWYELPGPGEYELVVSYQGDESPDGDPEGLLPGVHSSGRVLFTVTA